MDAGITIREIVPEECAALGTLLVDAYSQMEGFPSKEEQPGYYQMLENIGSFTDVRAAKILVALSRENELLGGVVYFGDMLEYGSGGTACQIKNASGIRLLGVHSKSRGMGIGNALTRACIQLAKDNQHSQIVLHTTSAMQSAWRLYESLGFMRSQDLDFKQEELPVFGFRLDI
ncbi:MAG: GNAT family N-acetyltransferase [Amphritea sp.]